MPYVDSWMRYGTYVLCAFEAVLSHCRPGKLSEVGSISMPREDSTEPGKQSLKSEPLRQGKIQSPNQ